MLQHKLEATIYIGVFLATLAYAQDPRVTIKQTIPTTTGNRVCTAFQNTDLVMDCYVENLYDNTMVRWQREYIDQNDGLKKTQSIAQDMALEDNIHYSLEKPTQYTWRLRVRGIQVTDEGTYTCFVQLTQISRSQDLRVVYVVIIPYLDPQQTTPDTQVTQGDNLDMVCNATGRPMPTVLWSRLGAQLLSVGQEKFEGTLLPLKNIQPGDRGVYMCTALNTVGSFTNYINLNVRFQPTITVQYSTVQQAVGYRVELQCFVEANPLPTDSTAAWLHGGTTYSMTSDGYLVNWIQGAFNRVTYELIITNVQSTDYGTFTCRVTNDLGTSMASITLQTSSTPVPSIKLNRVISGKENPEGAASLPPRGMFLMSLLAMLVAMLLSC